VQVSIKFDDGQNFIVLSNRSDNDCRWRPWIC
jgi:hypothetical protein